jgi:putative MATE family efflux protein
MFYKKILHIALPALSGFLGLILFDVVDIFWIEKLGNAAVAGVAAAGFIVWSLYSVMHITNGGAASLVAQYHGANDQEKAWDAIVQAFSFSMVLSILVSALIYPNMERLFALMGLTPETCIQAIDYFKLLILGFFIMYIDMLGGIIFNAYGDNKISNLIMFVCLIINGVLDPILMFGWLGCPEMGIEGAAWATLIGHLISLSLRFALLRKKGYIPPFSRFISFKINLYPKIAHIGLPNAITAWIWSVVYPVLTRIIAPFGMIHVSALGVCHRIENFPYFLAVAFGIAMTTLVGNALGRNDHSETHQIVKAGLKLGTMITLPFTFIFFFFPAQLIGLLTSDPELIAAGVSYMKIICITESLMAWELILGGVFTGLGKTVPTLYITIPITLIRIPLAWLFAVTYGWGANGVWVAIAISTGLKGIGLLMLYNYLRRRNRLLNSPALPLPA